MKPKDTYDLLVPLFESISKKLKVSNITFSSGVNRVFTCDTLWLSHGKTVTIGAVEYTVVDLMPNEWVDLKGQTLVPSNPSSFDIVPAFFFKNTTLKQAALMNAVLDSNDKLPMIWVHDISRERFFTDPENSIERRVDLEIYFLVDADSANWLTPDHARYAIKPMRNLAFGFIQVLEKELKSVERFFEYELIDRADFGLYQDKGNVKRVLNDHVSGTQLNITLGFKKGAKCSC